MIPIRDRNPVRSTPYVTILLIAANVFVFLFLEPITEPNRDQTIYFACNASIPYEVTHGTTLGDALAQGAPLSDVGQVFGAVQQRLCPDKSVWGSILYSMFLHGGLLHIASNMLFLWIFGNNVEDKLGRWRYPLFYLAAGLAATYAQSYLDPSSAVPLVGASGAIAGVLGAYILMFPRARVVTLVIFFFITVVELPAVLVLGVWFLLQLFQSAGAVTGAETGGVAYMAHVAGFVAGMVLLLVLRRGHPVEERRAPTRDWWD